MSRRHALGALGLGAGAFGSLPPRRVDQLGAPSAPGLVPAPSGPSRRQILTGPNQGQYVYTGTPAAGNLIESSGISPGPLFNQASLDPTGHNAALPGDTTYFNAGTFYVASQNFGGGFTIYTSTTEAGPWSINAQIQLTGTVPTATDLTISALGGNGNIQLTAGISKHILFQEPASALNQLTGIGADPFQSLGTMGLAGEVDTVAEFRLSAAEFETEINIQVSFTALGAGTVGNFGTTLPVGYRPLSNQTFPIALQGAAPGIGTRMSITTGGTVSLVLPIGATNAGVNVRFPNR